MQEIKKDEKLISANEFYEATLRKQRSIINQCIRESMGTGNPIVKLPFDTYPQIEKEMKESGWEYESDTNDAGDACAAFYPQQYRYDYEEEDETEEDDGYEIVEDEGTTYKKRRKNII